MLPYIDRIEVFSDGSFQPLESGFLAKCIPLTESDGSAIDVVAWRPRKPLEWWRRKNVIGLLGEAAVARASFFNRAVNLYATPADWLNRQASDRFAACIVDWTLDPRSTLSGAREIDCKCPMLTEKLLDRVFAHARPSFKIFGDSHGSRTS